MHNCIKQGDKNVIIYKQYLKSTINTFSNYLKINQILNKTIVICKAGSQGIVLKAPVFLEKCERSE